jgi:CHAD domain-containing protein
MDDDPPDSALHEVRILAKHCRYAAEAVAPAAGRPAARLAAAIADLQTVLGDHQDTIVAEAWLRNAAATTPEGAVAAGELILLQRWQRARLRARLPAAWKAASAKDLRSWL